jgi:S-adenosylmethionine hydrolase
MVAINIHDRLSSGQLALMFCFSGLSYRKGWITNVIGKEINSLKQITELKASISHDTNMFKGHVVYIDHFGNVVTNISKRQFIEFAKGPYEIIMKTKTSKPFYQITLQLPAQINIRLRIMKEKNWLF